MYTELCVYLNEGRFKMIVLMNFHDSYSIQSGGKFLVNSTFIYMPYLGYYHTPTKTMAME